MDGLNKYLFGKCLRHYIYFHVVANLRSFVIHHKNGVTDQMFIYKVKPLLSSVHPSLLSM